MSDQADGLRALFARRAPALAIVAGCDVAKATVAVLLARQAAAGGATTLLVDGTAGRLAQRCAVTCRFELADVAAGDVGICDVLRRVGPGLWLLPAARALTRAGTFTTAEAARLAEAFASGIPRALADTDGSIGRIVVHAADGRATRAVDAFGRDGRAVIVASEDRASLHGAYFEMKALAQAGVTRFELVTRVEGSSMNGIAYLNLAATARRFLDIDLADGGSIAEPATSARSARASRTSPMTPTYEEEVSHAAIG